MRYERFVSRHGEVVAQAVLENLERFEGRAIDTSLTLADRWHSVMSAPQPIARAA